MIVNEYDEKEFFDKSIKMLEKDYGNNFANDFKDIYIKQQKEIEQLKRQIKIKNKYCQLIYDIGFDYDGYEGPNDLKMIIDELVSYSIDAINSDDKKVMYEDSNGVKSNILMEEING